MNIVSQIIQFMPLPLTKLGLFLLTLPLLLHPFLPNFTSFIFLPLLTLYKILYKNHAFFYVYNHKTKKPICCAVIHISCNNKKFITITDRLGIAYFTPQNTQKCHIQVTHPAFKDIDFNITNIKDNVANKTNNNSLIYIIPNNGISFSLTPRKISIYMFVFIIRIIFILGLILNYIANIIILLHTFTLNTVLFVLISSSVIMLYIHELFINKSQTYPKLKLPTPLVIYNLKNNQPVAIVENKNVPIVVERGNYYTKVKDTLIPLKTKKYGALYFIDKKAI